MKLNWNIFLLSNSLTYENNFQAELEKSFLISFSVHLALMTRYPTLHAKIHSGPLCKRFLSAAGPKEAMYKESCSYTDDNSENVTPVAHNRTSCLQL